MNADVGGRTGEVVDSRGPGVVGAFNFKDWYVTIWFRDPAFAMPPGCACCRDPLATERATISWTIPPETRSVEYSLCSSCKRHAQLDERAIGLAVGGAALVLASIVWVNGLLVLRRGVWLSLMIYGILFLLVFGGIYTVLGRFIQTSSSRCPDLGFPVERAPDPEGEPLLGTDNERADDMGARHASLGLKRLAGPNAVGVHVRNMDFARDLIKANGGSTDSIPRIDEKS